MPLVVLLLGFVVAGVGLWLMGPKIIQMVTGEADTEDVAATPEPAPPRPVTPPAPVTPPQPVAPAVVVGEPEPESTAIVVEPVPPAEPSDQAPAPPPPPPAPSAAFKTFVESARINGVFQGSPPRALINGRTVRPGETLDLQLGITFERVDVARKFIYFREASGAELARKY